MSIQGLLDLQGRDLEAARLDDVHAVPPKDPVAVVIDQRHVPCPKPSVDEGGGGRLRIQPVFEEDPGTANEDLAGAASVDVAERLVHQADLDPRERPADVAGDARTDQWVRDRHPELRHPVTFQQAMTGDRLPSSEDAGGQGGRPAHHQAKPLGTRRPAAPVVVGRLVPGGDQLHVDRRDGHEDRDLTAGQRLPRCARVEVGMHHARRPAPERGRHDGDHAVDVMERQDVEDRVGRVPAPCRLEDRRVRRHSRVRPHGALRSARRPAREEEDRAPIRSDTRQVVRVDQGPGIRIDQPKSARGDQVGDAVAVPVVGDDDRRIGVIDGRGQFGRGMRDGQRDAETARPPDRPLGHHGSVPGSAQVGDPCLLQIGGSIEQDAGERRGFVQEVGVGM
jgi:hypothetical protein